VYASLCVHILLILGLLVGAKTKSPETLYKDGMKAFERGRFDDAAKAFAGALKTIPAGDAKEQDLRQRLALSLYSGGDKEGAKRAYAELIARFPSFRFDPNEVFPETVQFFEGLPKTEPPKDTEIKAAPAPVSSAPVAIAPATQPITKPPWKWYYLTPLGIGQYLAGSPVRGTIFLLAELGFIAMNVVGYALLANQRSAAGSAAVHDVARANTAQLVMDIGFFGIIGSAVVGALDGIILEP
jgi:hypothetical protein